MPEKTPNPILQPPARKHVGQDFTLSEVQLANRNAGICLETLRHDVTPIGMHYLLTHFDVPFVESADDWLLKIEGLGGDSVEIDLAHLRQYEPLRQRVTLECAGNGRALVEPRWASMPWSVEAVGTAVWGGVRLADVLSGLQPGGARVAGINGGEQPVEWVFSGADRGVDHGHVHLFERSLSHAMAMHPDVMLAWQINDQPLPPQHGYPLRLIVPGWYGMASVKWLNHIKAIDHAFQGYQQASSYQYREDSNDPGTPITAIRVRSLMIPPGIPDWLTRQRLLEPGQVTLRGRAWAGNAVPVAKVEIAVDGEWQLAELEPVQDKYAWQGWQFSWQALPGERLLQCRATDANGQVQPLESRWDQAGFGNNGVQSVRVWVEDMP